MKVSFDNSFYRSIDKLKEKTVKERLLTLIDRAEKAENFSKMTGFIKIKGFGSFFRYRIGDYRIGIEKLSENHILFIIIEHRKNIYRKFPKNR